MEEQVMTSTVASASNAAGNEANSNPNNSISSTNSTIVMSGGPTTTGPQASSSQSLAANQQVTGTGTSGGVSGANDTVSGPSTTSSSLDTPLVFPAADVKHFVGGFHSEVTEDDIRAHFSQFGGVADVKIMKDSGTGRSRGFAFVTMSEPCSKKLIAAEEHHYIGGRKVSVRPYTEHADVKDSFTEGPILKRKIFIGGINPALGHDALENYFSKYGPLEDATIMRYPDGRSRGFGFVVFQEESTCRQVLEQRNHCVTPRDKVEVKPCQSRNKSRNMALMHQGGGGAFGAMGGGGMGPHPHHGGMMHGEPMGAYGGQLHGTPGPYSHMHGGMGPNGPYAGNATPHTMGGGGAYSHHHSGGYGGGAAGYGNGYGHHHGGYGGGGDYLGHPGGPVNTYGGGATNGYGSAAAHAAQNTSAAAAWDYRNDAGAGGSWGQQTGASSYDGSAYGYYGGNWATAGYSSPASSSLSAAAQPGSSAPQAVAPYNRLGPQAGAAGAGRLASGSSADGGYYMEGATGRSSGSSALAAAYGGASQTGASNAAALRRPMAGSGGVSSSGMGGGAGAGGTPAAPASATYAPVRRAGAGAAPQMQTAAPAAAIGGYGSLARGGRTAPY